MEQDLNTEREPAIITPDIILEKDEEKIIHTLLEDENIEMDLVNTTDTIKNMDVVYDEVLLNVKEEDFIINEVISEDVVIEETLKEQTILTFDLPISTPSIDVEEPVINEEVTLQLEEKAKNIPVKDYIELITVTEANEEGETRYALDDYIVLESAINQNTTQKEEAVEVEKDMVFEKKVIEEKLKEKPLTEDLDPVNSPISELLIERANERRLKMKDFNYKFNSAKIDDIEKEPAYKRQGVNLEDVQHSSETNASRLSIGSDENDDVQLRSNNSFLHDNVD